MSNEHHKEDLTEFRLQKLEEAVSALSTLKDIVTRWDVRFSANEGFLQCPVHKIKMEEFEKRMNKVEEDMGKMKKFVYQATGALVIISIIVQLLGPMLIEKMKESSLRNNNPTVEMVVPR